MLLPRSYISKQPSNEMCEVIGNIPYDSIFKHIPSPLYPILSACPKASICISIMHSKTYAAILSRLAVASISSFWGTYKRILQVVNAVSIQASFPVMRWSGTDISSAALITEAGCGEIEGSLVAGSASGKRVLQALNFRTL
jgi:hypothetical protein